MAVNSVIQGTAADLIKKAMVSVDRAIERAGVAATMILQVHDELVFEVPEVEIEAVADLVRERMENAMELSVPLVAEPSWGTSWADTK